MDFLLLINDLLGHGILFERRGCLATIVLVPVLLLDYWLWTRGIPVWILVAGTAIIIAFALWPPTVKS